MQCAFFFHNNFGGGYGIHTQNTEFTQYQDECIFHQMYLLLMNKSEYCINYLG